MGLGAILLLGSCSGVEPVIPLETGSIAIDGEPNGLGAGWVLTGPNEFMLTGQGDTTLTHRALGDYVITWQLVTGWLLPDPPTETRTVRANLTITFQGIYAEDDPNRAVLVINPEPDELEASWRLSRSGQGGGLTGSGDDILTNRTPGTYTVTWRDEIGWVTPDPTVLAAASPETTVFTGTYGVDTAAYPQPQIHWDYGDAPLPEGFPMVVGGSAYDEQDGQLPPESLAWVSDLDGPLIPGEFGLVTGNLSVGTHEIRLRAEDRHGLAAEDTVTLRVVTVPAQSPAVTLTVPDWGDYTESQGYITSPVLGWDGTDPAAGNGLPAYVRFLFKAALLPDGETYAQTRAQVEANLEFLAPMSDPWWSPWIPYSEVEADRRVIFPDLARLDGQGRLVHYLFVIQAWSETGAIGPDRVYADNLAHFHILPPK